MDNIARVYIRDLRPSFHVRQYHEYIVARVLNKSRCRSSPTGHQFFQVILADDTGKIDLCIFEDYVDFYNILERDKAYCFTGLRVQERTRTQNATGCKYPAQLTTWSNRTLIGEFRVHRVDLYSFNPMPIESILEEEYDVAVDVIGVCTYVGDVEEKFQYYTGIPFLMRKIILEDETGEVTVALFEDEAVSFSENNQGNVIAMQGARTTRWGPGGSLSLQATSTSRLHLRPVCDQADDLMQWYTN